ncbi:MAG: CoA transferase, partial [Chloroflexi bacterium]|nr:CoA transferase [Chloroflexota bacterium]
MVEALGNEWSVCRTSAEWLQHPHALASGMVVEVEDPGLGKMLQPGINARMSATPGSIRSPAPQPDADRTEILTELKSTAPRSIRPISSDELRSALHGAKVLDLCIILAGPTCGRTLAEFGADVIKIDSPYRERVAFHNEINRAKRSILLDLKTKEGLDVFWCLLEDADVVVQNFRKGVAERLGIGYEDVRQR